MQLQNKDMLLNQQTIEKQRVKEKYNNKIQAETDKISKELETKLRRQRELLQVYYNCWLYIHYIFTLSNYLFRVK